MSEYSLQAVAHRAGVVPDYVKRLVELGILTRGKGDTFSGGDVPKVRLVQTLDQAGVPLDGLAFAIRDGHISLAFMASPFYERFAPLSDVTFQEISAKRSIPVDLLMVVREAIGFGTRTPRIA